MFPEHENLLPAFDTQHADLGSAYVKKPIFGREGHNVTIVGPGLFDTAAGDYGSEGYVWQAYQAAARVRRQPCGRRFVGDRGAARRHRHARGRAAHHSQQQPIRATHYFEAGGSP